MEASRQSTLKKMRFSKLITEAFCTCLKSGSKAKSMVLQELSFPFSFVVNRNRESAPFRKFYHKTERLQVIFNLLIFFVFCFSRPVVKVLLCAHVQLNHTFQLDSQVRSIKVTVSRSLKLVNILLEQLPRAYSSCPQLHAISVNSHLTSKATTFQAQKSKAWGV